MRLRAGERRRSSTPTKAASSAARSSFVRYLAYFVSLVPLGLGYLWVALDKRKQGWHDKIAGTVVIYLAPDEPSQRVA